MDGLRAVAVLSVILFHIDQALLPGGFVGVDIFFVISGFLISRNIIQDIERGHFSILDFYRRRVKRIAPAMLVVVFATVAIAQTIMLPADAEWVADSALWSLASLSNVYFWLFQDVSYFAADSMELPLLHLWSLGVEEQFYLIWPLVLMLFYRAGRIRPLLFAMVFTAAFSFVLGEAIFDQAPMFAYYMLPTRAGELLAGAFVAFALLRQADRFIPGNLIEPVAWLGLALLVYSFFMLSERDVFPGLRAIPPTLGSACIIVAGHSRKNLLSHLLSLKPIVWIGLISYSAYLWHWPLLAFIRYGYREVSPAAGAGAFVATFVLAWLSYVYVEQPARRMNAPAIRIFLRQYIVPAGALGVMSLGAMYIDGYGLRNVFGNYRASLEIASRQPRLSYTYDYVCQKQRINADDLTNRKCIVGATSPEPPRVILWGDSNASHYVGMLGSFAKQAGFSFRNVEVGSCPPLDDDPEPFVERRRLADCRFSLDVIRPLVEEYPVVIVSSSWTTYRNAPEFLQSFIKAARRLAQEGKLVIILGRVPIISGFDRLCRQKSLSFPLLECPNASSPIDADVAGANATLRAFALRTENVEYFDANDHLCPNKVCSAFDSAGRQVYFDGGHITVEASWRLGQEVLERDGLPQPFRSVRAYSVRMTQN